ncbi:MAG: hypothetical protein ACTTHG_05445 [Treponemataceae bacterium]
MKRRESVSMMVVLAFIVSAVLMMTGCPQAPDVKPVNPGNAVISKKNIIEFDATEVMCKKVIYSPYTVTDINNGDQIHENDELKFTANFPKNQLFDNWYINDVRKEHATNSTITYKVKATDFVDGKMKVRFTTRSPVKGNVEFDATVTCKKWISSSPTDINNGDQIQENDELQFESVISSEDQVVENWYINGVIQEDETNFQMIYKVKATDFDTDGKIRIRFTTRSVVKGNVEFDTTVTCKKLGTYTDINNGDQIQEEDSLEFKAVLTGEQSVKNWYVNGVIQEDETDSKMDYTVGVSSFVENKLKISFTTK